MNTAYINVRTDESIKRQAEAIFDELGMNMSTAINIFLKQTIREKGIPFALRLETLNEETIEAIKEAEELLRNPKTIGYNSVEELKQALNED